MAGISQQISPDNVLPLLAHNVYTEGYQEGRPTEFLRLLDRYVHQARELQILAGASGVIRVAKCADAEPLLHILGYRLRRSCGDRNATLVTADPERAFLTIDSGFPLTRLEEALQRGALFTDAFSPSRVPVLLKESDWTALSAWRRRGADNLVDVLLHDPSASRLYWALDKNDAETQLAFEHSPGLRKLLPYAAVLDFYGGQISIRSGRVIVPGGTAAEPGWKDLVGASPGSPGDFVLRLVSKDNGWLATYFDCLSRVSSAQQAHWIETPRLKRLYAAFRATDKDVHAAGASFRRAPGLLILFTRLQWESSGQPHVPGGLDVWKEILSQKNESKLVHDWANRARQGDRDQLLEAMVAFSRMDTDSGPLEVFLLLSDLDNRRSTKEQLSAGTVLLLARNFPELRSWYPIFSEFPELNDESIARFVNVASAIGGISNHTLAGDTAGILQANIGLWQILARQGEIPDKELNASWQNIIAPFGGISSSTQLFDAGRASLGTLLLASSGKANRSEDEIVDLLAGPAQETPESRRVHAEVANRIHFGLEGQRLVSLDTLLTLGDGLNRLAQGAAVGDSLLPLASELREFEMPRPIFTNREKIEWAPGPYDHRHAELQVRTDLTKVIKAPGTRAQLETARGQLAPFLRDTLVGLNYAYYEPPGAQILRNDPLFVRSHDFSGVTVMDSERLWQVPLLVNAGTTAGGGAYLVGSLADLPYVLATTEQNFIAPERVQALIWEELAPELLVSATVPRWWNVSSNELHAVTLYQRSGEELLAGSVNNEQLRAEVTSILSDRMAPKKLAQVEEAMSGGNVTELLPQLTPADTFYLAAKFRERFPGNVASLGSAGQELEDLYRQYPAEVSWERLSKDFGVPHPRLAGNYGSELVDVEPFPAFEGDASRLFGESWDSSNLYWARLADQRGYSPVTLNILAPELTRLMVAKISATNLEDWPALLRAMREAGEEFQQGKISLPAATNTAVLR